LLTSQRMWSISKKSERVFYDFKTNVMRQTRRSEKRIKTQPKLSVKRAIGRVKGKTGKEKRCDSLDRDVVALLESVSDELASVDDEAREGGPEDVVGDHFRCRALLLEDELADDESDDKVEEQTAKDDDEHSKSKGLTSAGSAALRDTAATSVLNREVVDVLNLVDINPVALRAGLVGVADDSHDGLALKAAAVLVAASVLDRDALAGCDCVVDGSHVAGSVGSTARVVVVVGSTLAHSCGVNAARVGHIAEVDVVVVEVRVGGNVGLRGVALQGRKIVFVLLAGHGDGGSTLAICKGKNSNDSKGNEESAHLDNKKKKK